MVCTDFEMTISKSFLKGEKGEHVVKFFIILQLAGAHRLQTNIQIVPAVDIFVLKFLGPFT